MTKFLGAYLFLCIDILLSRQRFLPRKHVRIRLSTNLAMETAGIGKGTMKGSFRNTKPYLRKIGKDEKQNTGLKIPDTIVEHEPRSLSVQSKTQSSTLKGIVMNGTQSS